MWNNLWNIQRYFWYDDIFLICVLIEHIFHDKFIHPSSLSLSLSMENRKRRINFATTHVRSRSTHQHTFSERRMAIRAQFKCPVDESNAHARERAAPTTPFMTLFIFLRFVILDTCHPRTRRRASSNAFAMCYRIFFLFFFLEIATHYVSKV